VSQGVKLIGLLVPYDVPSREVEGFVFSEMVLHGAFGPAVLSDVSAQFCLVAVNHQRDRRIPGAKVRFVNKHKGLYVALFLPPCTATSRLLSERATWRGLSIGFDRATAVWSREYWKSPMLAKLTHVDMITCVSVVTGDKTPAYGDTWISEYSPSAVQRVRDENRQQLLATWGADYERLPVSWWCDPLQGPELEAAMAERGITDRDRERTHLVRLGEVKS